MRKWRLPLTYPPKIEPVLLGTCRQTIRPGSKKKVGDLIRFYVWSGKPYRSKQINLTEYKPLKEVHNIVIGNCTITAPSLMMFPIHWNSLYANELASKDGIVPPTGLKLQEILISKNGKIPADGIEAQILRW